MKATRATRGLINRTIIETELCATLFNEETEEVEKRTSIVFSTNPLKELKKEVDIPEGHTLISVKALSAKEKIYGMTPKEFVLHGTAHNEETTEEK